MKKRILALLLGFVLCFSLLGTAFAAEGDWIIDENGNIYQETTPPPYVPPAPSNPAKVTTGSSNIKVSDTRPDKGDTVTAEYTGNIPDGKEPKFEVTDDKGNPVAFTVSADGKTITFTMPDGKVTVKATLEDKAPEPPVNRFTDVDANRDKAYYDAILWAAEKGITTGTGDGTTFSPYATCTRAQNVTFLWRALGEQAPTSAANPFGDVDASRDASYYNAILWATENGITTGVGGGDNFNPYGPCTRAQFVTFLWRAMGKPAPTGSENPFTDVDTEKYAPYYEAILWAVEKGITTGTNAAGTTFSPDAPCTRAQVATFLYRALAE